MVAAGRWTAYFDNSIGGSDPEGPIAYLSRTLSCQGVVIRDVPHTIGLPGIRDGRSGSVQFMLFGPLQTEFINYVRTVAAAYDGNRWVFVATGTEQAFEESQAYQARRIRDRFTSDMLERYCQALGIDVFNPHAYGPDAVFLENGLAVPEGARIMSLAQVQEWLEIMPGMADRVPG